MNRFDAVLEDWPANGEVPTCEGFFPYLCFQLWGLSEKGHARAQGAEYMFLCESVCFHWDEKVLYVEVKGKSVPAYETGRRIFFLTTSLGSRFGTTKTFPRNADTGLQKVPFIDAPASNPELHRGRFF
ncbi:hypothetical protein K3555_05475 [Leisingera sp. M527]|uniref:hypothetical protein n=1 Tax=Leisingera sp. M527 TaxID=2867014 RepID=UPI0021A72822|nr:hypothetical protein [Leisingera sp. M527]UWQ33953.1 hypothetical protein K3555_05475 [Leisingera sp. M527]